ncbi:MAG: SulP family inorganic anion transporter, partial [Myxococcales bacterium]|nr:SulP family inorganic anion transporter [Myxococcales bacterium]
MPIVRTVRDYRLADLPYDLLAGLTVSVVDLPQSMAFALIAGVPAVYGLYTAIFLAFLGALFTSSRFLSVGPTNTQSLLVAATVARLSDEPATYIQMVVALTLVKGIIQLAFAAARMGQFVRYVSATVMVAFTAGAGVLIFAEQVPAFLGFARTHGEHHLPGVLDVFWDVGAHADVIAWQAILLGVGSLAVILIVKRISHKLPGPLFAVVLSALVVTLAGWDQVGVVGEIPRGLPGFSVPDVDLRTIERLLPGAFALALLGMLESVAIAKSIAHRTGQRIDADQEFFGQGFANLVGAFLQCMPGSGSFSRTALQYTVGARTRVASIFCAIANAVFFLALAPLAFHIPLASLAAILFYVAWKLVDVRSMWRIAKASRRDGAVALATFGSALLLPLTYAIYVGIFLNIALYL